MRAIFQLDLLVAVKRLICNRLNYQLWLGWTWLSNSCQAGQAENLDKRRERQREMAGNKRHLSLYALGQVVKLERMFSYSRAPVVPHQKKSERQSGSRTTCPTCSQAVEAAPAIAAQVVIPLLHEIDLVLVRVSLTSTSKLAVPLGCQCMCVSVCVCFTRLTWALDSCGNLCAVCLCVCEGDLGEDKAPQIKLSTLLA